MLIQTDILFKYFMTEKSYDVAIIGGGHNGLTTACYLAKMDLELLFWKSIHILGEQLSAEICILDLLIQIAHMSVVYCVLKYLGI